MALKRQCPEISEREAQVKSLGNGQCPEVREREAQAMALKRQCQRERSSAGYGSETSMS